MSTKAGAAARFLVACSLALAAPSAARAQIAVSAHVGFAINFRTLLTVRQQGEETLHVRAKYRSRPFSLPLYYGVRIEWFDGDGSWGLELIHTKLYLQNAPPEIEHFEVSHGYNMIFIDRGWRDGRETVRAGAGIILAHAETVVRGKRLDGGGGILGRGYVIGGPVAQLAWAHGIPLGASFTADGELKATAAWSRIPVAGGSADVPNIALHAQAGPGYRAR